MNIAKYNFNRFAAGAEKWLTSVIDRAISLFAAQRETVIISEIDYYRILFAAQKKDIRPFAKKYVRAVKRILKHADIRALRKVPRDIVTMNSELTVQTRSGRILHLKLVYPGEADRANRRISIFSRLGICLLGKREGEKIKNNYFIEKVVYQPEADNVFN